MGERGCCKSVIIGEDDEEDGVCGSAEMSCCEMSSWEVLGTSALANVLALGG